MALLAGGAAATLLGVGVLAVRKYFENRHVEPAPVVVPEAPFVFDLKGLIGNGFARVALEFSDFI